MLLNLPPMENQPPAEQMPQMTEEEKGIFQRLADEE
jgi:hypothetical protein